MNLILGLCCASVAKNGAIFLHGPHLKTQYENYLRQNAANINAYHVAKKSTTETPVAIKSKNCSFEFI